MGERAYGWRVPIWPLFQGEVLSVPFGPPGTVILKSPTFFFFHL